MFIDQIEQRISVRTYQPKSLNPNDKLKIVEILEQSKKSVGPFGSSIHPFFVEQDKINEQEKIGTYGFVKNAPAFFGASTKNARLELIDFGYLFEKLILEFTDLNLGTVWLGGTFHRSQFDSFITEDQFIPAISPIGYEENKSFTEKVIRIAAKSDRRKPINLFVFGAKFSNLNDEQIHQLTPIFRYVQLAPSASNKQPWRFIVDDHMIHLYLEKTVGYADRLPFEIQYLDMGIAICHLEYALLDTNIKYKMKLLPQDAIKTSYEYIISFILEKSIIS